MYKKVKVKSWQVCACLCKFTIIYPKQSILRPCLCNFILKFYAKTFLWHTFCQVAKGVYVKY